MTKGCSLTRLALVVAIGLSAGCLGAPDQVESDSIESEEALQAAFEAGNIEAVEAETLAEIRLSNGNTIRFVAVVEDGELGMLESGAVGGVMYMDHRSDASIADMYLELTRGSGKVPRVIAERLDPARLSGRTLVDGIPGVLPVSLAELGLSERAGPTAVNSCTPGEEGAEYFDIHHCGTPDNLNSWCDKGARTSVTRQGQDRKKDSIGRTVACNGSGQVRHYYRTVLSWHKAIDKYIHSGHVFYDRWDGLIKRYRRIHHNTHHPDTGGFIRAWSQFSN